ncbi:uncharacterized protein LOC129733331 [Wyeomyia smithii]|uniref:uncharacterized protein LOC129733331 n=1 Tax=Wyeomyia smithii TaxID=174621 RepID=UPI002467BB8A|nr:uncharacterized protein LOC129733331 [Wyeomyia smithii]
MNLEKFNLSCDDLERIIQRYYNNPKLKFKINSCKARPFSTSRVGYLGDHFILELETTLENATQPETVEVFLKLLPDSIPELTKYLNAIGTFRKEVRLYDVMFPNLSQYARFAPKVYLSKDDRLLVFENLNLEGFRTIINTASGIFDKAHLQQALGALAKFHCASLTLETKTGKTLEQMFPKLLDENCWILKDDNPRVNELENAIEVLAELVEVIEKDNPKLSEILLKLPDFVLQIYDLVKPSPIYRNVACHGDLWGSNLMFKYSDDGLPVDCLIVDYQFARYAPPAYDVNMLITLTTTGEFRKRSYNELINFYYEAVCRELIKHCLSPGEIFSRTEFLESCRRHRTSGLIDNFLMNHVTLLPRNCVDKVFSSPEEYANFSGADKIRMCLGVLETDATYRGRITGIIRDLIEAL